MPNIALISYHSAAYAATAHGDHELRLLRQFAAALVQQGHAVWWVSATDTADALARDASLEATGEAGLPATCRYVVPCQTYTLAGVRLFCADRTLWQEPALHTRLFTFLRLLQRELPCQVWHAWGSPPAPYLAVYTARFLHLPTVVSYGQAYLQEGPQQPFLWQWVAQHTTRAVVFSPADRTPLRATSGITLDRVQVVPPHLQSLLATMPALYSQLSPLKGGDA
jgi:Glycosyltransferase Family 4